ncbi:MULTISPECIES: ABC transporter ATP-binding protein [Sulfitobacter]|jgi:branched-chain amino acid transport system ATP-binding protein|uniref:ABC transporter ATP-binding protein n=2 Tax=Alphaproteobacteria TaxID=28211 RepID=UPI000C3D5D60|nr:MULTISPECIES: ABC transporter ATP-binding protein [unclassified Sulfitobacter]MBA96112.1 ABC transporter ATP-binding protein [Roseobacter sp.]MBV48515.1 ABC transporter ATP-binding protein [Roseobacter sp.]MCF7726645.1 ATP-binding cassette domain-containing protein [Sulfitobacter sp. M22]MCF7777987.1 ATP-binding cassette domain-containing protein [Sulfitobacter sp. M220]|tara:strand:+ start:540 stop:1232 length:693 start_codon:yes stop_codon:yes gene_type:complete
MLELNAVNSGYGETQVLYGMNVTAQPGRVLAILGRNGAGKSTTLKTIMGLLPTKSGTITFDGAPIAKRPFDIAKSGIAYVPETRDIFPSLSVRENLEIASKRFGDGAWTIERVIDLFPRLGERLDNGGMQLSGGEQQMLAIARALLMNPRLLVLDEPTEGLAPIIVKLIHDKLQDLRREGLSMVLVEQNFGFATSLADDVVVVGKGQVVWSGSADEIRADVETQHKWLGV